MRDDNVKASYQTAADILPELGKTSIERTWVGVEAFCVDEVPIIGSVPGYGGITVAAGFTGHGFALSPITGQLVSELVLDGKPSISLDEFAADRFSLQDRERVVVPSAG